MAIPIIILSVLGLFILVLGLVVNVLRIREHFQERILNNGASEEIASFPVRYRRAFVSDRLIVVSVILLVTIILIPMFLVLQNRIGLLNGLVELSPTTLAGLLIAMLTTGLVAGIGMNLSFLTDRYWFVNRLANIVADRHRISLGQVYSRSLPNLWVTRSYEQPPNLADADMKLQEALH